MVLNSLVLKIIAMVLMTIDHIGLFIENTTISYIFRIIGRLALPIFVFLVFEGVRHTKNIKKYMLKLLIMSGFMYIACTIASYVVGKSINFLENIYLSLFLIVFTYYLLLINKNKLLKLLIVIPIIFFIGTIIYELAYTNKWFEYYEGSTGYYLKIFLSGLCTMYPYEIPILFFIPIIINYFYEKNVYKTIGKDDGILFINNKKGIFNRNIFFSIGVVVLTLVCWRLTYINIDGFSLPNLTTIETYSILSIILILLYNGKKGYNNKILQNAFYLYYPLHIGLIALIFYLI